MSNCDFLFESFGESSLVSSERYSMFDQEDRELLRNVYRPFAHYVNLNELKSICSIWFDQEQERKGIGGHLPFLLISLNFAIAVNVNQVDGRCIPDKGYPLGVENGSIPDSSMTSSSHWAYDGRHLAINGRLNFESVISQTQRSGAWVAADDDADKWIKVYFLCPGALVLSLELYNLWFCNNNNFGRISFQIITREGY